MKLKTDSFILFRNILNIFKGLFRILANVYDGAFSKIFNGLMFNYIYKKGPLFDT